MTPETLKQIEDAYDQWCNCAPGTTEEQFIDAIMGQMPDLITCVKERDTLFGQRDELLDRCNAAVKELDAAQGACADMLKLLNEVAYSHSHPDCPEYQECDKAPCVLCERVKAAAEFGKDYVPKSELEDAQKACAERRHAIQILVSGLHHKALNDPAICKMVDRALSSDCGKGYHHEREIEMFVEALKRVVDYKEDDPKNSNGLSAGEMSVGDFRFCLKALAHWEKVKDQSISARDVSHTNKQSSS